MGEILDVPLDIYLYVRYVHKIHVVIGKSGFCFGGLLNTHLKC